MTCLSQQTEFDSTQSYYINYYGYVYGVRLQTKVRVNQDTFCMIMN